MTSIQKSSEEPMHGELRSRMAQLWRVLRKRSPVGWRVPEEERRVQMEFSFAGSLPELTKKRWRS
jgi:hypothetical protein